MSGTFGDMGNLLKQAQEMHKLLEKAREELRKATVEGQAGGGAVRATANGEGMIVRLQIQRELAASDPGMLEETVLAAVRDALAKAAALREERLSRISGGLSLPGLF